MTGYRYHEALEANISDADLRLDAENLRGMGVSHQTYRIDVDSCSIPCYALYVARYGKMGFAWGSDVLTNWFDVSDADSGIEHWVRQCVDNGEGDEA
jgi:hypothetical protein